MRELYPTSTRSSTEETMIFADILLTLTSPHTEEKLFLLTLMSAKNNASSV